MREPSEILVLENFQIKIFEENDYGIDSKDNWWMYSNEYINGETDHLVSLIGIQLFNDDKLVSDCIIGSEGVEPG